MTQRKKIVLAAAVCAGWSTETSVPVDAIVIAAWSIFPEEFGLRTCPQKYPNSLCVIARFSGDDGLIATGMLTRSAPGTMRVTREGLLVARSTLAAHPSAELARVPAELVQGTRRPPPLPDAAPEVRMTKKSRAPRGLAELPKTAPPFSDMEMARLRRFLSAYNPRGFLRGAGGVNEASVRSEWRLSDRAGPENVQAMAEVGRFLERAMANGAMTKVEARLLRSLHSLVIDRSRTWLEARGVDPDSCWR